MARHMFSSNASFRRGSGPLSTTQVSLAYSRLPSSKQHLESVACNFVAGTVERIAACNVTGVEME